MERRKLTQLVLSLSISTLVLTLWTAQAFASDGSVLVRKNLFSPDRKPELRPGEAPTGPASPFELKEIQLDGVIIYGPMKKALLRVAATYLSEEDRKKGKTCIWVRENDMVGAYRVMKIEPKAIYFEQSGQNYNLSLYRAGKIALPVEVAAYTPPEATLPQNDGQTPAIPPTEVATAPGELLPDSAPSVDGAVGTALPSPTLVVPETYHPRVRPPTPQPQIPSAG